MYEKKLGGKKPNNIIDLNYFDSNDGFQPGFPKILCVGDKEVLYLLRLTDGRVIEAQVKRSWPHNVKELRWKHYLTENIIDQALIVGWKNHPENELLLSIPLRPNPTGPPILTNQ